MMANINAPNNDKNILNEFYDANTFSNMKKNMFHIQRKL